MGETVEEHQKPVYLIKYNWFIGDRHMEDAKHVLNNFFPTIQGYLGAKTKADSSL